MPGGSKLSTVGISLKAIYRKKCHSNRMRRRSFIDSKLRGSRTKILIIYNTSGKNINRNGCCSLFMQPMFPISYAIFSYPPPQLWLLPIQIQWVPANSIVNTGDFSKTKHFSIDRLALCCQRVIIIYDLLSIGSSNSWQ